MKFLPHFCNRNKTCITDILNVKRTLHKVLPTTTYVMCNASNSADIDTTVPLFHKSVTFVYQQAMVTKREVT